MKQEEVFKRIGGIITELNDQFEYLKTIEGPLNELELELFLANSHFLGDHVLILSKLNSQNTKAKQPLEKPDLSHGQNFFVPLVQTPAMPAKAPEKPFEITKEMNQSPTPQIALGGGSESDSFSFMPEEEPETIRHELVLDEADWDEEDEPDEPQTLNQEIKEEVTGEEIVPPVVSEPEAITPKHEIVTPDPEIIIPKEEFKPILQEPVSQAKKEEVLSINDRMSAKLAEMAGVGDYLKSQGISDLKQAITLNDKLLFIKELFNGYSLAYSEAIEILNRFSSVNEADLFLKKNYVIKNNWEKKPETTARFYALLNRRYE